MMFLREQVAGAPLATVGVFAASFIVYFVATSLYSYLSSPLRRVPGPILHALSRAPYVRHVLAGTTAQMFADLHKQYGEVVRVSPTEVSFTSGETAWQDIYGFRIGKFKGHSNTQKVRPIAAQRLRQDPMWYARPPNGANSILIADDTRHSQGRKLLSHAFSEKALAQQEPLVMRYVDQLIDGLKDTIRAKDEVVDMAKWYNWTTFDIIADLTFGEPFGCLQDHATHKYITLLFNGIKAMNFQLAFRQLPVTKWFSPLLLDKNSLPPVEVRREFLSWVSSQVQKRLDRETERPDFMGHILANNGEKGYSMSKAEMDSNASLMLSAGSETTATMLSGATYALLKNPRVLEKLKKEVRERWNDYHEIDVATTNKAPYLNAVISEALRYFPPVPAGFNRQIQKGGEFVSGYFLPEGTSTSIPHYAAYHSGANFKDADEFIPERWLDNEKYADDKRSVHQPFSFGPRNCLGKNLAYAEMRLILAKFVWTFDMELAAASSDWMERCKVYLLWWKPELFVKLTEVVRD